MIGAEMLSATLPPFAGQIAFEETGLSTVDDSLDRRSERDRILLEHVPAVRYIARRIHERLPQHVDLEDLISAGMVGLIDAFSKFDHGKKVQFKSYAQFRIRGAILDSLRLLDWGSRELRRKGREIEEAVRLLTQRLGRVPSEQEIADEMRLSLAEYQTLLGDLKGLEVGSLHMERSEDSGDEELAYLPGPAEDNPLLRCMNGEVKQCLADAIEGLPEKERLVLTLYYFEELTMKQIGQVLGVVESRVSQIRSSAVVRLRASLNCIQPVLGSRARRMQVPDTSLYRDMHHCRRCSGRKRDDQRALLRLSL